MEIDDILKQDDIKDTINYLAENIDNIQSVVVAFNTTTNFHWFGTGYTSHLVGLLECAKRQLIKEMD